MSHATTRGNVVRWNSFTDQSGLDPSQLMCVTGTIVDFGGVSTTAVYADLGAAPSAATHVEGVFMPFGGLVVAASCKYVHDAAACSAAADSTLDIEIMASPGGLESVSASYASLGTAIGLVRADMDTLHWSASATGLGITLPAGTTIAIRSLVLGGNIDNGVNADLSVALFVAVPQSGLGLPT
jgi:hypothetical protein